MASITVTQSDDASNTKTDPGILKDEFLPIVEFKDPAKYKNKGDEVTLAKDDNDNFESEKLSKYLDEDKQKLKTIFISTTNKTLKLPFTVKQGAEASWDEDGIIDVKLSIDDKTVKLTSKAEINTKYGSEFEVELEFTSEESKEFYLRFYARDNVEDDWFDGDLKDVYCGCVKIKKTLSCICQDEDWPEFQSSVSDASKVKYGRTNIPWMKAGDRAECYHYALHQLRVMGYWVKTERWNKKWGITKELNAHIYQLALAVDVAGMKKGPQKAMFKSGLNYLKQAMKSKSPVMVGLDYNPSYANDDMITDHFAAITGCGRDSNGRLYFYVTDNAFASQKYYCDCEKIEIRSEDKGVIITQIRESKKL